MSLLDDPAGGTALFGLYHPRAVVIARFEPEPIAQVGAFMYPLAYQSSWDMYEMNHPGAVRRPALGAPRLLSWREEGEGVVAWWEADELLDGRPLVIATGYVHEDETWYLDWLTLAESVADWGFAEGRARTLADHEYAHANLDITPRSWLDLAYYRLFGHEKPAIATLPDARFSCGMSSVCCAIDYRITVRPGAQAFLDAVPWETVRPGLEGTVLPPAEDGHLLLKDAGSACRFLDENRHCVLHKAYGRPVFNACTQFPLKFAATPDGVIVAGSPLCGAVRKNLGPPLADKQAELHGRLAVRGVANLELPETFRLTGATTAGWETFRDAEALLIAALDREDLPLRRRLWLGSRLLEALDAGGPLALEAAWETEPIAGPEGAIADAAAALLETCERGMDIARPALMHGAKETAGSIYDGWLASALKNMLFSKAIAYPLGLAAAHHVNVLTFLMVERLEAAHAPAMVPETVVINLVMRVFHGQLLAYMRDDADATALLQAAGLGAAWLAEPAAVTR